MEAENALEILGGKVVKSIRFDLPNNYGERHLVIIEKIKTEKSWFDHRCLRMHDAAGKGSKPVKG